MQHPRTNALSHPDDGQTASPRSTSAVAFDWTASRTRRSVLSAMLLVSLVATMFVIHGTGSARAAGSLYYVSTSGSDSNPGTIDRPWRTIAHGLVALRAGDTLDVRGGTYVEQIMSPPLARGTDLARIRVQNYPNERPVLQGLLWITGAYDWTFDGLNVTWDSARDSRDQHMVKFINGAGWVFRNAEVWGAHSYAAILVASTVNNEPSNWVISRDCIHDTYKSNDTNQDQLIYVNSGLSGTGGSIRRNVLFNATNGMGIKLGGPSAGSGGTANVEVRYNTIYNTAQSMLISWASHNNLIHDNLMVKTGSYYGNVRGYELNGHGNEAYANLGSQAKEFILNDPGYTGVYGTNNTFGTDPQFDNTSSCAGFHPATATAQSFGKYAPVGASNGTP